MRDLDHWFGTSSVPRYSSSKGDRFLSTRLRNDITPFSGRSTFDNLHGSTFSRVVSFASKDNFIVNSLYSRNSMRNLCKSNTEESYQCKQVLADSFLLSQLLNSNKVTWLKIWLKTFFI